MERARALAAVKLPAPLPGRKPKEELRRSERCPAAGIARPGVASAGPGGAGGGANSGTSSGALAVSSSAAHPRSALSQCASLQQVCSLTR